MIIPLDCSPFVLQQVILGEVKYGTINNETLKTIIAPLMSNFDSDMVTTIIRNICNLTSNQAMSAINDTSPNTTTSGYGKNNSHLQSQQQAEKECYESG